MDSSKLSSEDTQSSSDTAPENNTEPVAETATAKKGPSEADKAAYIYKQAMPRVLALASNMKAGELYRVFANYVQFPLVEFPKKLRSNKENELFSLLIQTAQAKNTLMQEFSSEIKQAEVEATLSASKDIQGE